MISSFSSLKLADDRPFIVPTGINLANLDESPLKKSAHFGFSDNNVGGYNFPIEEETPQPISYSISGMNKMKEITLKILSFIKEKPLTCKIDRNESIFALKQLLEDQVQTPPEHQHLIYQMKTLENKNTLAEYDISNVDLLLKSKYFKVMEILLILSCKSMQEDVFLAKAS